MGWFWADAPLKASPVAIFDAPHSISKSGAVPPPECPMHNASAEALSSFPPRQQENPPTSSCPVVSPAQSERYPSSTNPSLHLDNPTTSPETPSSSVLSKLNPLNYMPTISNTPTDPEQDYHLPLEKETSTIPRGDAESNWEYPSPQQMYNAMLRKQKPGMPDIDITAVESMVAVHNFLNEGAWDEIVTWETLFSEGLKKGWENCSAGEHGILREKARREFMRARREALAATSPSSRQNNNVQEEYNPQPKLLRFQGRPNEPTPKSRILATLAWAFPNSFVEQRPFDRHDWYIARQRPDGSTKTVRYVIDYYTGGVQATGEPVFYLDIRPAIDGPSGAAERLIRWTSDVWYRASGGEVREMEQREKAAAAKSS